MSEAGLTHEEAEAFARGLYYLANVDEMDAREEELIREFITESGAPVTFEALAEGAFSVLEASQTLSASYLRHIFLKTAIVMIHADGKYTSEERHALGEIADAFGLSVAEFADIEQEAEGATLD